jgi:DNA-binding LytR/AlgR family response regulator
MSEPPSSIAEKLSAFGFVRIHRSVVVNLAHIDDLRRCVTDVYLVRVSGGKKYTIIRPFKNNLRFLAEIWLGTEI